MADRSTRVSAGQLLVSQVAVVGVIVATTGPGWVLIGVAAAALAVLVATFGRSGGRWWYQAVASQRRFRRRRRVAAAQVVAAAVEGRPGPPHMTWLRTLSPGLVVRSVRMGGASIGIGADQDGWFAAAEVGSLWDDDPGLGGIEVTPPRAGGPVPFTELATLIEAAPDRVPVSSVQVISVPASSPRQPTPIRPAWVAVRINPADAVAAERAGGVEGVQRAVAAAAMRAARTLDRAGWPARALDPDGLLSALVDATALDGPPQEHWSTWRSGRLVHTCYDVTGWEPARGMLAPGVGRVVVSYAAKTDATVLATVAAEPGVLARICRDVVQAVEGTGMRLRRLDGEQALAMYASAPTGIAAAHLGGRRTKGRAKDQGRLTPRSGSSLGSTATTAKGEQR